METWRSRGRLAGLDDDAVAALVTEGVPDAAEFALVPAACARARLSGMPRRLVAEHEGAWQRIREETMQRLLDIQQEQAISGARATPEGDEIPDRASAAEEILASEALTGLYPSVRSITDDRLRPRRPPRTGVSGPDVAHLAETEADVVDRHNEQALRLLGAAVDQIIAGMAGGRGRPDPAVYKTSPEHMRGVAEAVRVWIWHLPVLLESARNRTRAAGSEPAPSNPVDVRRRTAARADSPPHLRDALRDALELAVPDRYANRQGRPMREDETVAALIARRAVATARAAAPRGAADVAASLSAFGTWALLVEIETLALWVKRCVDTNSKARSVGAAAQLTDAVGELVTLLAAASQIEQPDDAIGIVDGVRRWGSQLVESLNTRVVASLQDAGDPRWEDTGAALTRQIEQLQDWLGLADPATASDQ